MLLQLEAAFLQHWALADTAKALHPRQRADDTALLRAWLLEHRSVTLDSLLADEAQQRALGQAGVDDRNAPLLELLLQQPGFSAQGGRAAGQCLLFGGCTGSLHTQAAVPGCAATAARLPRLPAHTHPPPPQACACTA